MLAYIGQGNSQILCWIQNILRRNVDSPALVIGFKFDKTVDTAIDQIESRNYPEKVVEYTGDILLVGVSYDRERKTHSCVIEYFPKKQLHILH